ncbi:hypothetical protein EDD18DRAFT_1358682 [Armillaria luteobubalina]|uniref:Uncharacterized protein n=1 Tax=Armillaria luteobubalina TaxID=153913 RepID=A0AA39PU24_9AGAR|nr:hypothetical protein EDD18DRAFT_1358682 [Armillaria luteobubalina]
MDETNPDSGTAGDDFLDTLRNLPKLPDMTVPTEEGLTEGWCGTDNQPDNVGEQDNLAVNLGPQASVPLLSQTKVETEGDSNPLRPVTAQLGPASNTRSMRGQTETSFLSAGGEPSTSLVPRRRICPKLQTPPPAAEQSEWKADVFNLCAQLDAHINSLESELKSLPHTDTTPSPELCNATTDITVIQRCVGELSAIITSRFLEQHGILSKLKSTVSPVSSLTTTLAQTACCVMDLELASHNEASSDAYHALEVRVAELEKMLLTASPATALPHLPSTSARPVPTPRLPPSEILHQVIIIYDHMPDPLHPWDGIAQMLGCMTALSTVAISDVKMLPAPPGAVVVTFKTEQNAKEFMTGARTLPEWFRSVHFLWADSPASPLKPTPSPAASTAGPFVDDHHGFDGSCKQPPMPHVDCVPPVRPPSPLIHDGPHPTVHRLSVTS